MVHKNLAVGTKKFARWNSFGGWVENCACEKNKKYIENGTPKKDTWHWSHCISPNKVCPPISTHQRQVPRPTEWGQAIGLHHPVAGGLTDQSEREVVIDCQARQFQE